MDDQQQEHYDQWTSCQMYGHVFEQDEENPTRYVCRDCNESYEEVA